MDDHTLLIFQKIGILLLILVTIIMGVLALFVYIDNTDTKEGIRSATVVLPSVPQINNGAAPIPAEKSPITPESALADYGTEAVVIYQNDELIWIAPVHAKGGCNTLVQYDKETNVATETTITACGGNDFAETKPLYIEYCDRGIVNCFDFETLYGYNLDTGKKITIFEATRYLTSRETLIQRCYDSGYGQMCEGSLRVVGDKLHLGVFQKNTLPTMTDREVETPQPSEFINLPARTIIIDLTPFIK